MAQHTVTGAILTTCGFTLAPQCNFIMGNEGLTCWTNFTLIGYDNLASIAKSTFCHTTLFSIGVFKLKCLTALEFWIGDKTRMNKLHVVAHFTQATITTYIWLYEAFLAAKDDIIEFVNRPQLNKDD